MTRNQRHHTLPTGNDLWDQYFPVRMLYLHSRSVDHVRRYGMRVSGVESIDRNLPKQEIFTEMNIDRMFEKHRSGVTIRLTKYEDSAKVYRIIHAHLIAWAEYLSHGVNVGNAPLKDLIELDEFANVVYDKAKAVFSTEAKQSAMASNFMAIQSIHFKNILTRAASEQETRVGANGVEIVTIGKAEAPVIPERSSFKDLFAEQVNSIGGWRDQS